MRRGVKRTRPASRSERRAPLSALFTAAAGTENQLSVIWISVVACETPPIPCPHPFSRGSSSQWKLLAPRARGFNTKKKKKSNYCLLPLSRHYWKLVWAQSGVGPRWFLTDSTGGKLTPVYEASHLQWLLKIQLRLKHVLCKQVLAQDWALKMHPVSEQSRAFHRLHLFSLHASDKL